MSDNKHVMNGHKKLYSPFWRFFSEEWEKERKKSRLHPPLHHLPSLLSLSPLHLSDQFTKLLSELHTLLMLILVLSVYWCKYMYLNPWNRSHCFFQNTDTTIFLYFLSFSLLSCCCKLQPVTRSLCSQHQSYLSPSLVFSCPLVSHTHAGHDDDCRLKQAEKGNKKAKG